MRVRIVKRRFRLRRIRAKAVRFPISFQIHVSCLRPKIQNKRGRGCISSQETDVTFTNPDYFHEENVAPPGHAAVDGKVDRIGEADERVDHQHDVLRHLVVQERVEAERDQ